MESPLAACVADGLNHSDPGHQGHTLFSVYHARFRVKKLDNFCVTLLHVTHNRVKSMQKHVLLKLQTSALDLEFGFGSD